MTEQFDKIEANDMDLDLISKDERRDILAKMADLYYNQQLTQIEIARQFDTTRFKVAKMLQEARDEEIVEIRINYNNERSIAMEHKLMDALPLQSAIVVDTKYSAFLDGLKRIGEAGALHLAGLLADSSVFGIAWGKSIQPVVEQLSPVMRLRVDTVQLVGNFDSSRPTSESRELMKLAGACCLGESLYLDAPIYFKDTALRDALKEEPIIKRTFDRAKNLDVVLTGMGGSASLPMNNPTFASYVTDADREAADSCPGCLFGYVLDRDGEVADIDLNKRLMAVPFEDVTRAKHRVAVVSGRNKVQIAELVARKGYINEIVTDVETASLMLERVAKG